jgi:serine/threonine protein kinase
MTSTYRPDQTRYELEHKLGEGLNSVVWRATRFDYSGETRRTVALKLPKEQTSVPFLRREFESLQRINSVYCARVIAWETFDGKPALALDWIDGVTLFELAQKVSLSLVECDCLVQQIYLGLRDLNSVQLFHGDLHPNNIMIDREGCIRLIDFASGQSIDGVRQAAPAFVAPEIWAGGELSYAADLFALGVIRRHLANGFRSLPSQIDSSGRDELMCANPFARKLHHRKSDLHSGQSQIASHVSRLLAKSDAMTTQVIATVQKRQSSRSLRLKSPALFSLALALSVMMAATLPVRAEAPPEESPKTATLSIRSESWVRITMNGKDAGYAPLVISKLHPGRHRISWKTAARRGEFYLQIAPGDVVRLEESRSHPGLLEVR